MTRKVAVIGMGHVGSTVAHYIVANGFADDLVLIDTNEKKVNADALDFEDAMANLLHHTNIYVNDYGQLKDTDVIVSALGNIKLQDNPDADRFAELPFTRDAVPKVAEKIKESGFNGKIVAITNPVDVITSIYQSVTGLPKNQVIGTGTLLDSARMKRAVASRLNVDPRSVEGYNLGEHGNSQFTAWSTVRVLEQPITELAKKRGLDLDELDHEARMGAGKSSPVRSTPAMGLPLRLFAWLTPSFPMPTPLCRFPTSVKNTTATFHTPQLLAATGLKNRYNST